MGEVVLAIVACALLVRLLAVQVAARTVPSRIARLLRRGHARRAQALARRAGLRVAEAEALVWLGQFDRALALAGDEGPASLRVRIEALLFSDRVEEARALLLALGNGLRPAEALAFTGFLLFSDGDREGAQRELTAFTSLEGSCLARAAHLTLAEIARQEGQLFAARDHLLRAGRGAGDLFVGRIAGAQLGAAPPRLRRPLRIVRDLGRLATDLALGLDVLALRTSAVRARRYLADQVLALAFFDIAVMVGIRCLHVTGASRLYVPAALALAAPPLGIVVTAYFATRRGGRDAFFRLLGGFLAALPPLLVLAAATHAEWPLAAWALAAFLRLAFAVARRSGALTLLGAAVLFGALWLWPMHLQTLQPLFYEPSEESAYEPVDESVHDAKVFEQAERVLGATGSLASGREGVVDLYFVGAAGYASQDVFRREVLSAQSVLDERFDTRGRSVVLSNDSDTQERYPLASNLTLRRTLAAVGQRMNRDEDILFLFASSHGSQEGLALRFPRRAAFDEETLDPAELNSMLGAAAIKWRVLVIAGCESGVFVRALSNDYTLITTAASSDRYSYGCAMGNSYTDFGKAIFGDALLHDTSFPTAFDRALRSIDSAEAADGRVASRPQLVVGSQIRAKLRTLEVRLAIHP